MSVSREQLEAFCAEAKAATDAQIAKAAEVAAFEVDAAVWGARAGVALEYLTAHYLCDASPGLGGVAAGPVQSVSVGGVSKTFAVSSAPTAAGPHASTRYGAQYDAWLKAVVVPIFSWPTC